MLRRVELNEYKRRHLMLSRDVSLNKCVWRRENSSVYVCEYVHVRAFQRPRVK